MGEGGLEHSSIFIRDYYLQFTNFLSLSGKESVIASPVFPVYTLRKKGKIKSESVLEDSHDRGIENAFGVVIAGMALRKNRKVKTF